MVLWSKGNCIIIKQEGAKTLRIHFALRLRVFVFKIFRTLTMIENRVTQKMETIQNTFLHVHDIFFALPDWKQHIAELESADFEFRSIALNLLKQYS